MSDCPTVVEVHVLGPPGPGVPINGALGQVLMKRSATDYDVRWADPPSTPLSAWLTGSNTPAQAFNDAATYLQIRGGGRIDLEGRAWTFDSQLVVNGSYIGIWADAAVCTFTYTGGPSIVFGDGSAKILENWIHGGTWKQAVGVDQPLLKLRWQRGFKIFGRFYSDGLHSFLVWGDQADTFSKTCTQLIVESGVEVNQRSTGNVGHCVDIQNAAGGLYWYAKAEGPSVVGGVPTGVGLGKACFYWADNAFSGFDYALFSENIIKGYDYGFYAPVKHVANIELSDSFRIDDSNSASIKLGDATTNGKGWNCWKIHCRCGGAGNQGKFIHLVANNAVVGNVEIDAQMDSGTGEAVLAETAGVGLFTHLAIHRVGVIDWAPAATGTALVKLNSAGGAIHGHIWQVSGRLLTGHPTTPDYIVYNNTGISSLLRIGSQIHFETVPTIGLVYDPNIGNALMTRWCEIGPKGHVRNRKILGPFYAENQTASADSPTFIAGPTTFVAIGLPAHTRGRIVRVGVAMSGTIVSGTVDVKARIAGATSVLNIVSLSSADGADAVKWQAVASTGDLVAENDRLACRVVSTSLNPTTLDFACYLEMLEC